MRGLKFWGEIRDPVHGYIFISEVEKSVLDTYPLQRLHRVKQLGNAHLTYPGADHTRFGHSIGAMHLAGVAGNKLMELGFSQDHVEEFRLAALLHDVGHGPFSHLFEEAVLRCKGLSHEDLTRRIIEETEVRDAIENHGFDLKRISELSVGMLDSPLSALISGPFDIDKLDFLLRDSYYTGVEYGRVDSTRLLTSIRVVDGIIALELPASLYALESFLISRYEMFKAVYFHRTVRSAWIMLAKAINIAYSSLSLFDFQSIDEYLQMDDGFVEFKLRDLLRSKPKGEVAIAAELFSMLEKRKLFKSVYEAIIHVKDVSHPLSESLRSELEQLIATRAGVEPWMVVVDTPMVPSLPYTPTQPDPMDIPVCEEVGGRLVKRRLTEFSTLIESLKGYVDIIRVYSHPDVKTSVEDAARKTVSTLLP